MKITDQTITNTIDGFPKTVSVETTLYDLIEAVSQEVNPVEEPWIPEIVNHLLSFGKSASSNKYEYPLFAELEN